MLEKTQDCNINSLVEGLLKKILSEPFAIRVNLNFNHDNILRILENFNESIGIAQNAYKQKFYQLFNPLNLECQIKIEFSSIKINKTKKRTAINPINFSKSFGFRYNDIEITQIIEIDTNIILIMFSNQISFTNIVELHQNFTKDEINYKLNDPKIQVGHNSNYESIFIYESHTKMITKRSLGISFESFEVIADAREIDIIKKFYYLSSSESFLILTETGLVYRFYIRASNFICISDTANLQGNYLDIDISFDQANIFWYQAQLLKCFQLPLKKDFQKILKTRLKVFLVLSMNAKITY